MKSRCSQTCSCFLSRWDRLVPAEIAVQEQMHAMHQVLHCFHIPAVIDRKFHDSTCFFVIYLFDMIQYEFSIRLDSSLGEAPPHQRPQTPPN
jgi:hypothetical protein